MGRIIIAGVIGGIVLFVWGAASWMAIDWHRPGKLADEELVTGTLGATATESGVYFFPGLEEDAEATEEVRTAAEEAWAEAHRAGPIGFLVFRAQGAEPMPVMTFVKGYIIDFFAALFAAAVLAIAAPASFRARVLVVFLIGLYTAAMAHLTLWNWMHYPFRYSLEMAADAAVGALLLGIVLAAIVRPGSGAGGGMSEFEVPAGA